MEDLFSFKQDSGVTAERDCRQFGGGKYPHENGVSIVPCITFRKRECETEWEHVLGGFAALALASLFPLLSLSPLSPPPPTLRALAL